MPVAGYISTSPKTFYAFFSVLLRINLRRGGFLRVSYAGTLKKDYYADCKAI